MKKIVAIMMALSAMFCQAGEKAAAPAAAKPEEKSSVNVGAMMSVGMSLIGTLAANIPTIIKDMNNFMQSTKTEFEAFKKVSDDIKAVKEEARKTQLLEQAFLHASNLQVMINNLMYKVMLIVKGIGPVITAGDSTNGPAAGQALKEAAKIIMQLNPLLAQMKDQIVSKLPADKKAGIIATPKADEVKVDDFGF